MTVKRRRRERRSRPEEPDDRIKQVSSPIERTPECCPVRGTAGRSGETSSTFKYRTSGMRQRRVDETASGAITLPQMLLNGPAAQGLRTSIRPRRHERRRNAGAGPQNSWRLDRRRPSVNHSSAWSSEMPSCRWMVVSVTCGREVMAGAQHLGGSL